MGYIYSTTDFDISPAELPKIFWIISFCSSHISNFFTNSRFAPLINTRRPFANAKRQLASTDDTYDNYLCKSLHLLKRASIIYHGVRFDFVNTPAAHAHSRFWGISSASRS